MTNQLAGPLSIVNSPEMYRAKHLAVREAMLSQGLHTTEANFRRFGTADVGQLFGFYDEHFFDGWLRRTVAERAAGPVSFRLSSTMTRSGGKTTRWRTRGLRGKAAIRYEIALAGRLLMMNFGDSSRPINVCGLRCHDRLEAAQRIMEHEIIHLVEFLLWSRSSCTGPKFRMLAGNIFGHTDPCHELITPVEHAAAQFNIRVGSIVRFEYRGRRYAGRVNRIHRRATVLVESANGEPYDDGRRYEKYYVPLGALERVG